MVVVAVTGCGGTGKTSVARLVAKLPRGELIVLNDLAEKLDAYAGYDRKRKSKIVDMKRLGSALKKLADDATKRKVGLIVEGLYAHEFPADIVIVLRCEPRVLERRLRKKYTWPTKIRENVEAEMIGVITDEALEKNKKVYEIDTTKSTVRRTVTCAKKILAGKGEKYRVRSDIEKIDWLES
jgi:adenylate kinase